MSTIINTTNETIIASFLVKNRWITNGAPIQQADLSLDIAEVDFWSAMQLSSLHYARIGVGAYFGHLRFRAQALTLRLVLPQDVIASNLAMSARLDDLRQRHATADMRQRPLGWRDYLRQNGHEPMKRLVAAAAHLPLIKSTIEARGGKIVDLNALGRCQAELEILQWQMPDEDLALSAAVATLRKIGGAK